MIFTPLPLEGAYVITPAPHRDARGWFVRTYCAATFAAQGLNTEWAQMNSSSTAEPGSVRGLHFQRPPWAEVKLVRCAAGAVFDVMVDLRAGSASFGQSVGLELSAENGRMAYIPEGFAHGFQTCAPDSVLIYMHSAPHSPDHEGGLLATDPALGIDWPMPVTGLSPRDSALPPLSDQEPLA